MHVYWYEIYFNSITASSEDWKKIILRIARLLPWAHEWRIIVKISHGLVRCYIVSKRILPVSIGIESVILKSCEPISLNSSLATGLIKNRWVDDVIAISNRLLHKNIQVKYFDISIRVLGNKIISSTTITYLDRGALKTKSLLLSIPAQLLAIDFKKYQSFTYKKVPKYLKVEKVLPISNCHPESSILKIQTYPYTDEDRFLSLDSFNFAKHSFIIGGSGVGKSKFIASFVHNIYNLSPDEYRILIIDPHAALKDDLLDLKRTVIDFTSIERSINLFAMNIDSLNVGVELLLSLFKSLMAGNYNDRLERVMRYGIYLLLIERDFSFINLRQLILSMDYRNQLLAKHDLDLPTSAKQFFLTDFQELKSQAYNLAIAPIIAFIDEMILVPVFNSVPPQQTLVDLVRDNFLNIFSLSRLVLGDKVVQVISGLIMQQIFCVAGQCMLQQHLFVIIDEVSVVENPILARFLSELRKFNVSVVLAGQYFEQISPNLRSAILANTTNYYIFRTSKADAATLVQNLDIKPANSDNLDDRAKLITGLKQRECIVRVEHDDENLPAFKARTLDLFLGEEVPEKIFTSETASTTMRLPEKVAIDFNLDDVDIGSIMRQTSTSRKKL